MPDPTARRLQPGQTIAHYRLIAPLGAGGMGIAAFTSRRILFFASSPDGQSLALTRRHTDSDVVLLTDTTGRR